MTGSGTEQDPYIVMNCDDFCNMTGGSDKYYKLGADIDFAQYDKNETISINCKQIDGDGHTVSNFFRMGSSSSDLNSFLSYTNSYTVVIRNTNFKGIYLSGGSTAFTYNRNGGFTFENCRIALKVNNTANNIDTFFHTAQLTDSEILIEGTSDIAKAITNRTMSGCLMKLDLNFYNKNVASTTTFFNGLVFFSGIIGNIVTANLNGANYRLNSGNILNSYFALNFDKISSFLTTDSFSGVNFYDKDVMANLVEKMPSTSNFYALTTEQCKSAEYLQSINFPCTSG